SAPPPSTRPRLSGSLTAALHRPSLLPDSQHRLLDLAVEVPSPARVRKGALIHGPGILVLRMHQLVPVPGPAGSEQDLDLLTDRHGRIRLCVGHGLSLRISPVGRAPPTAKPPWTGKSRL